MTNISVLTTLKVLTKFKFKRLVNQSFSMLSKKGATNPQFKNKRVATTRKSSLTLGLSLIIGVVVLLTAFVYSIKITDRIFSSLTQVEILESGERFYPAVRCNRISSYHEVGKFFCQDIDSNEVSRPLKAVLSAVSIELFLLFLCGFFVSIAAKEIDRRQWDLEWLCTLPVPLPTLINGRILERTFSNLTGFLLFWPITTVVASKIGFDWWSGLFALFPTFVFCFIIAICGTLADIGLRRVLGMSQLRNLQALASLLSIFPILLALSPLASGNTLIINWAVQLPSWVWWTPFSLMAELMGTASLSNALRSVGLILLQTLAIYGAVFFILTASLKKGLVTGSRRETLIPVSKYRRKSKNARSLLRAIQIKELQLLVRDKNFMTKTVFLPILFIGLSLWLNTGSSEFYGLLGDFSLIAAMAFLISACSLAFSTSQQLVLGEGKSLWMLYTFPQSLEKLLKQKFSLWIGFSLLYCVALLFIGFYNGASLSWNNGLLILVCLVGVIISGVVAACTSILGSDPIGDDTKRPMRIDYAYLYMVFIGSYCYAVVSFDIFPKMVTVVLSVFFALALVQKAKEYMPYLLDPSASPTSKASVADGLIAALSFLCPESCFDIFDHFW